MKKVLAKLGVEQANSNALLLSYLMRRSLVQTNNVFIRTGDFTELTSEQVFLSDCSSFFGSKDILQDQKISELEYALFLEATICGEDTAICKSRPLCNDAVHQSLQMIFLEAACSISPETCYLDFKHEGMMFVAATPDTIQALDETVISLCSSLYSIFQDPGVSADCMPQGNSSTEKVPQPMPFEPETPTPTFVRTLAPIPTSTLVPNATPMSALPPSLPPMPRITERVDHTFLPSIRVTMTPSAGLRNEASPEVEPYSLTTGALFGIIAATALFMLCVTTVYSGGYKEPEYDVNRRSSSSSPKAKDSDGLDGLDDDDDVFHHELLAA